MAADGVGGIASGGAAGAGAIAAAAIGTAADSTVVGSPGATWVAAGGVSVVEVSATGAAGLADGAG